MTLAQAQPFGPKQVVALIAHAFDERRWQEFADSVMVLRLTCDDLEQSIAKLQSKQLEETEARKTSGETTRQLGLETARALETLSEYWRKTNADSRLEALEKSSTSTSATLQQFQSHIDQLPPPPSIQGVEDELKELRRRFDSQQSALEAQRSKPTPPASPSLSSQAHLPQQGTSRPAESSGSEPQQQPSLVVIREGVVKLMMELETKLRQQLAGLIHSNQARLDDADQKIKAAETRIAHTSEWASTSRSFGSLAAS